MQIRFPFAIRAIVMAFIAVSGSIANADIVFSNQFKADFKFEVLDGPLAGFGVGTIFDFEASGPLTFTLDDSIPNATTMDFTNVTGTLTVFGPAPFAGSVLTPELEFVGGQLTNIVRGGGGVITSGVVSDLRMRWEMFAGPTRLYTNDSLPFNGIISGVPFGFANVIAGPDPFDVFLDAGLGAGNPLAIRGSDRFLTAVPEPSSFALLSLAGLGLVKYRNRRGSKAAV